MSATITIFDGPGDGDDTDLSTTSFAGSPSGTTGTVLATDTTPTTIFESELEGIAAATNISIAATTSITINGLTDNNLNLAQTAGNSVTFTAGTFTILGANDTITTAGSALTINASTTATIGGLNTNGGLITLNVDGAVNTVQGVIAGAGTALTKAGTGTLTLSATNTYTGATTVNAGTLQLAVGGTLGNTANTTAVSGGTLDLGGTTQTQATLNQSSGQVQNGTMNVGTYQLTGGFLQAGATVSATTTFDMQAGMVTGVLAGDGAVNKTTGSTVTFGGANTYAGGTTVSAGILVLASVGTLGNTANTATVAGTGILDLGTTTQTQTALNQSGGFVENGTINVTTYQLTGGTLDANATVSATTTFDMQAGTASGVLAGAAGLNKTTAGTVALSGNNQYTGATNINGGVLSISADANLGTVPGAATPDYLTFNGGTLQTTATFALNANRGVTFNAGGGTIETASATTLTYAGIAAGAGGLIKSGTGDLLLAGVNTYTGATTVNAGTLRISNAGALGATGAGSETTVASGATLSVEGGVTTAEALTLNGSGVGGTGALTGTGNSAVSGAITLETGTPTVGVAAGADTLTLSGTVGGTSLTKVGVGTLSLTGSNNYSGATNVNAGVLRVAGGTAISDTSAVTVAAIAQLNLQASETIGSLAGSGTVQLNANALTTGGDNSDTSFAGEIIGTGALTKAGTGTFTLAGNNTYTGATTVNSGTLLVNGSIASSTTTVNSTGTLGGTNGTVGAVNIASGGELSPGASAGKLAANGDVAFSAGASFKVELGGTVAGTDYDQLVAGGTLSLAGATLNASLLGGPVVGTEYKIIDKTSAGAVSGIFAGLATSGATATIGGRAFQINYAGGDGNDVTLTLGALKISGTDPIAVLADVDTTTIAGPANNTSPTQSVLRTQALNGDINGTVNPDVTIDGWGLSLRTTKSGGAIEFINNGTIVVDDAAANNNDALSLLGNGGGVHYSGTGSISNDATNTPDSGGMLIASLGGIGGNNLIEVGVGSAITADLAIVAADGTTTVVVSGAVTGTNGTAIFFGTPSFNNIVDLKPTAVITGNLDGSGNDDTVRLSGTSGSGTFDLGKINGDFSNLVKAEAATWTVTGALNAAVSTVIINGTLLVNGTVGTVLVTDGFGDVPPALLGGTGTVGNVLVQHAGILAPGASAGTLTSAGNVTLSTGSIFRVEIGGTTAGTQYDVLHLSGTGLSGLIDLGDATIQASLIGGFTPTVGQVFKIIDNDDTDAVANTFAGMSEGAGVLVSGQAFRVSYVGGDGNDVTLTAIVGGSGPPGLTGFGPSVEIEQAGPAAVPQILDSDVVFTDAENNFNSGTLVVSGLLAEDTVSVVSLGFDPGEFFIDDVAGPSDNLYFEGVLIGVISGGTGSTLDVTFNANATANAIDALIQNLTYVDLSDNPTFSRTLSLNVTDSGGASTGPRPLTVHVFNGDIESGTGGNDSFAPVGDAHIDAGGGIDTVTFGFRLVDATVTYSGNQVIIDGPSSHTVLSGFEIFKFTDGTVNNNDGDVLVDDLFYYSKYHDVWNAHLDADADFHSVGWKAGRDPDAFFSTVIYLSANPDVKAAGVDPLKHFDTSGWKEDRVPSINFDPAQYLAANPDVKAAGVDPLAHFLQFGAGEGRQPFAPTELIAANGFDYVYYLNNNPDVAAAGVDPFQHFQTVGWKEGRNPNALFDTTGYLNNYLDVKAANVNPLDHYSQFGWHEGRDPSVGFDTTSYLAAYADVNAAHVNPLAHFLNFGIHEGRSAFADGVWG
jgi:fibronectin-binding autotransporter adhesin